MTEFLDSKYKWWIRDLLELAILLSVIVVMLVIYIPRMIWDEEEKVESDSRFYIEHVYDVFE